MARREFDNFHLGIPWIFDIISAVVSHAYGIGKSFEVRLTLDILNLLTVILQEKKSHCLKIISVSGSSDLPCPCVQEKGDEKCDDSTLGNKSDKTFLRHKSQYLQ